ncbi:MAG: DNA repair protein RadA, partial [Flavobacteriaceae bacterium]
MAKVKTAFFCQNCGSKYPKWMGQCNSCKEWNTLVEEVIKSPKRVDFGLEKNPINNTPKIISEINADETNRISLNDEELNRVLGGGLVPGSIVLIGGEP